MPPQKTTKGSKQKKKQEDTKKRELPTKDEDPSLDYAIVLKIHSVERVDVRCLDGKTRQGVISGSMKKKIFVQPGDLVLIGKREYQDSKCDICLKYFPHEVQQLIKMNHIPSNFCSIEDNSKKDKSQLEEAVTFSDHGEEDEESEQKPKKQGRTFEMPPSSSDEEDEDENEEKPIEKNFEKQVKVTENPVKEEKQKPQKDPEQFLHTNKTLIKDKRVQQNKQQKKMDSDSDGDDDVNVDDI